MNAEGILERIAQKLIECDLDVVMIGNAAAALQGAPVTTMDFDFMFRRTPANIRKLKKLADSLGGVLLKPYYPVSGLIRLVIDESGLQLDFMHEIHGVQSFASLRSRSLEIDFAGKRLSVASLEDVIASKRAAARPSDMAVLHVLEATLHELRNETD